MHYDKKHDNEDIAHAKTHNKHKDPATQQLQHIFSLTPLTPRAEHEPSTVKNEQVSAPSPGARRKTLCHPANNLTQRKQAAFSGSPMSEVSDFSRHFPENPTQSPWEHPEPEAVGIARMSRIKRHP